MTSARFHHAHMHPRGMALVSVLWMVAALSIIATGLTRSIREEARLMSLARQDVQAQALGDAAIQVVLQAIVAGNKPVVQLVQTNVVYKGVSMQVQAMPLNGLIDINSAGIPLLERLLSVGGGMPPAAAQAIAQAIVDARERRDAKGTPQRFEAEEDLLRVPGVDYDLYARLAALLTADLRGSGKVNPMAAPVEVLAVLANGNAGAAIQIAANREAGLVGVDTSALDANFIDSVTVRRLRIQARVPMADGSVVRVSRSVDFGARTQDGAPWHTFRTTSGVEPVRRKKS